MRERGRGSGRQRQREGGVAERERERERSRGNGCQRVSGERERNNWMVINRPVFYYIFPVEINKYPVDFFR